MNRKLLSSFALVLVFSIAVSAQSDPPTEQPTQVPTDPPATTTTTTTTPAPPETTTKPPGQPFGEVCNGLLLKCNRFSETVSCLQRRAEPTITTTTQEPPVTTTDSVISLLQKKRFADVCETGLGATLGRCSCSRNCKNGVYVDDGAFDPEREICVGLVGSTCTGLVPNCVKNGKCNFLASKCVCNAGYVADETKHCVPA